MIVAHRLATADKIPTLAELKGVDSDQSSNHAEFSADQEKQIEDYQRKKYSGANG